MTEFKEGDEVLVKAKFVSRGEHFNEGLAWLKGGVTNADDFVAHITDIIPASALDVNKQLLEAAKSAQEWLISTGADGSPLPTLNAAIDVAEKGA
jgi:hypothetical protein